MNNLKWFGDLIHFCKLSDSCEACPYYLLESEKMVFDGASRPCFASEEALRDLSEWASRPANLSENTSSSDAESSWLQELIQTEFSTLDTEAENLFFLDDEDEDLF